MTVAIMKLLFVSAIGAFFFWVDYTDTKGREIPSYPVMQKLVLSSGDSLRLEASMAPVYPRGTIHAEYEEQFQAMMTINLTVGEENFEINSRTITNDMSEGYWFEELGAITEGDAGAYFIVRRSNKSSSIDHAFILINTGESWTWSTLWSNQGREFWQVTDSDFVNKKIHEYRSTDCNKSELCDYFGLSQVQLTEDYFDKVVRGKDKI